MSAGPTDTCVREVNAFEAVSSTFSYLIETASRVECLASRLVGPAPECPAAPGKAEPMPGALLPAAVVAAAQAKEVLLRINHALGRIEQALP